MRRDLGRSLVAACLPLLLAASAVGAPPRTRAECEAAHPAELGRPGKDVVWAATPPAVVLAMLSMADVTPEDLVLDLGAGDGAISIAAARTFGARAVGIEYDPTLAGRAACLVEAEGLADKVRIVRGDIFAEDFAGASVVAMYLLPQLNACVRHRILALPPGTRVVSHQYGMADWPPEETVEVQGRTIHLWRVPARVDGVWEFVDSQGAPFTFDLRQTFGALAGEVTRAGAREPLVSGTLRGVEVRAAFGAGDGATRFSGTVRGDEITGVLTRGAAARTATGRLRGGRRPAAWAEMPPGCAGYYGR